MFRGRRSPTPWALALALCTIACAPDDQIVEVDGEVPRLDPLPDVIPADWMMADDTELYDDVALTEDASTADDAADDVPDASPDVAVDAPRDTATVDVARTDSAVDVARADVVMDSGTTVPAGCVSSASGASSTWTCTSNRQSRQRCASGRTETVRCEYGCVPGAGGANATCSCGTHTGYTVWNCLADGDLHKCDHGAWLDRSCDGNGCSARPSGVDDVCNPPPPPPGSLSCSSLQWWNSTLTYVHTSYGWIDTDLRVAAGTPVQLRHNSRLDRTGVYAWGYMPEFTDLVTGARFRFLHLRPQRQNATVTGRTYPAGFIVGLSGGDTNDTGYPTYSTGAHLCVQTIIAYRSAFPTGHDACR